MLYGIGVVAASAYISPWSIAPATTEPCFSGRSADGVWLVLIGLMGSNVVEGTMLSTSASSPVVILVGIAHGFINAPVHRPRRAAGARRSHRRQSGNHDDYRFLERIAMSQAHSCRPAFPDLGAEPAHYRWIGMPLQRSGFSSLS